MPILVRAFLTRDDVQDASVFSAPDAGGPVSDVVRMRSPWRSTIAVFTTRNYEFPQGIKSPAGFWPTARTGEQQEPNIGASYGWASST